MISEGSCDTEDWSNGCFLVKMGSFFKKVQSYSKPLNIVLIFILFFGNIFGSPP